MDELVEAVLTISTWLTKVNLTSLKGQDIAIDINALAVTLHADLLNMRSKL